MHAIEIKASRWLGVLLLAMALLAGLAIALAELPPAQRWALGSGVALAAAYALARQRKVLPQLAVDADGSLWAREGQGEWREARLAGDSFVSPGLCVLGVELAGRRRVLTLLPDSTDADGWRRLRVSLRWGPRKRSDTPSPGAG